MKKSANAFTKKEITRSQSSWAGDNVTAAAGVEDVLSPTAFATAELGGIDHFKNIDQPEVSH